jgi:hypothetical protein
MASCDEDEESAESPPTVVRILLPVWLSKWRTWVNRKQKRFCHKQQEPITKTVEQLKDKEDPLDQEEFLDAFQDETASVMAKNLNQAFCTQDYITWNDND